MSEFEEISLKKIIEFFGNEWKVFIGSIGFCTLLSIIIGWGVITPVYETEASILMNIPEKAYTEYGEYQYLTSNPKDYFNLFYDQLLIDKTIDKLDLDIGTIEMSNSLSITMEEKSNLIKASYQSSEKDEVSEVLNTHLSTFLYEINKSIKTDAFEKFILNNKTSLTNQLADKENQLEIDRGKIKTIQNAMNDLSSVVVLSSNMVLVDSYGVHTDKTVSLENEMINEAYDEMLLTEAKYQEGIIALELELQQLKDDLKLLVDKEKEYNENPVKYIDNDQSLKILTSNISVLSTPSNPLVPVFPNKILILALGIVLGGVLGICGVILKLNWPKQ